MAAPEAPEEDKRSVFSLIEAGDCEQLEQYLAEDESRLEELTSFSPEGRAPLELAGMLGKGEVARMLVNKGVDVNAANKSGID